MSDRLPPLTALRAFEAAARRMSFAQAAAELNVTPAALSFQIKSLEEHLGRPVFRRLNRAVELTEAGRALVPGTVEGFAALSAAWRAARRLGETDSLTVTAGPAFTAKWLAPRLYKFAQVHRDIELRFSASFRLMDFDRDEIDVAIRFGRGTDEGLFSERLFDEWVTPMMSPALCRAIQSPRDLHSATLLHMGDNTENAQLSNWAAWFRAMDLGEPPQGGPLFSQPDHAIDAAVAGGGVVMGRISLTHGALENGLLVAPFDLGLKTNSHSRFLCQHGAQNRPQIRAFLDWILQECSDMRRYDESRTILHVDDIPR